VAKLKYTFKSDTMFKMLFVKYPELLKRLVAELLGIRFESIERFEITNSEITPEVFGGKFCHLDINMKVDGQLVNLEVQVNDEGDYPERVLYHWARAYSTALAVGEDYQELPRTVIISIVDFNLFACEGFHSEFRPLETTRHEPLSDKMSLHFFELRKLPEELDREDMLLLWLWLFNANTEDDLKKIKALEVPVMEQAIDAYNHIVVTPEFYEMARQRDLAGRNEASALRHAREERDKIWQGVVADKDAKLADKDAKLADKDTEIEQLRTQLAKFQASSGGDS